MNARLPTHRHLRHCMAAAYAAYSPADQPSGDPHMEWLRRIVEDPRTERFITALILINAVTLGFETNQALMARWGSVLHFFDQAILAVFVVEIAARIAVQRLAFFRSGWNIFDFVVVAVSLAPATDAFTVIRALRVLRLLRLVTVVPSLRRVVGGL